MDVHSTLESSLNGGGGTEERDYDLPPPRRRVPTYAIIFHIISTINKLLSALPAKDRRGADLSVALAHKTAAAYIFKLGQ